MIRARGFTLTEAIIASFLLVSAMLVIAQLFHAALRYGVWSENKALATYLAEKRMAELRRWAAEQQDWADPPTGNDPAFPAFTIDTLLEEDTLASPCRMLMQGRAQPRVFQDSLRRATVEVSWNYGASRMRMTSLLRDARRGWRQINPIVITGGGTFAPNESGTFTAAGFSPNGPIVDLRFSWSVEPVYPDGATGTLTPSVDGFTATFRNEMIAPDGTLMGSTGQCRIYATAVYAGEERRGFSTVLNLVP